MMEDLLIPLFVIGLAEMGDKTQLSILLLAARTDRHLRLLLGVMLAFLMADGFAIAVGSWVTGLVPIHLLKIISGLVFILFGIYILRGDKEEGESQLSSPNPFLSGFTLVFLSEWGDKTQIASALFAAEYNPWIVLFGVMTALTLLSMLAIYLGGFISGKIDREATAKVAGSLFIIIGLSFAVSAVDISAFADIL
jgi:putative Ca2+/H+ antiporter (TMEM165/GDT1 family)